MYSNNDKFSFQRARSQEQVNARQSLIIEVAKELFISGGISAVNFNTISEHISLSRQSIYKYYSSPEEILIDVLKEESQKWESELMLRLSTTLEADADIFAEIITESFQSNQLMLRLCAIYNGALLHNVKTERPNRYLSNTTTWHTLYFAVSRFFPDAPEDNRRLFANSVFAVMTGMAALNDYSPVNIDTTESDEYKKKVPYDNFDKEEFFKLNCYKFVRFFASNLY